MKPVYLGHPWVFAQAIASIDGAPGAGDPVRVVDPKGHFLGAGYYSPKSAIPVRLMSRDPQEVLEDAAIARRFDRAAAWRASLGLPSDRSTGYRLIQAEGDHLPGVVVDVYQDIAVVQLRTAGAKRREQAIFANAARVTGVKTVIEAAANLQKPEGFVSEWRVVRGADPKELAFRDRGFEIRIPTSLTQKTGYYFDQRDTRARVEALARGRRVLDAYAFVGSFGLAAARGGASEVTCVESSAPAVAAGSAIARHAGHALTFLRDDVKRALPELDRQKRRFDLVVVDPPKLAPTRRHLEAGQRAYRALNMAAMKLVEPGGVLLSCSCSAAMDAEHLMRTLAEAGAKIGREVTVFGVGTQAPDHPSPVAFPEGRYLDAVFARIG